MLQLLASQLRRFDQSVSAVCVLHVRVLLAGRRRRLLAQALVDLGPGPGAGGGGHDSTGGIGAKTVGIDSAYGEYVSQKRQMRMRNALSPWWWPWLPPWPLQGPLPRVVQSGGVAHREGLLDLSLLLKHFFKERGVERRYKKKHR